MKQNEIAEAEQLDLFARGELGLDELLVKLIKHETEAIDLMVAVELRIRKTGESMLERELQQRRMLISELELTLKWLRR